MQVTAVAAATTEAGAVAELIATEVGDAEMTKADTAPILPVMFVEKAITLQEIALIITIEGREIITGQEVIVVTTGLEGAVMAQGGNQKEQHPSQGQRGVYFATSVDMLSTRRMYA